MTCNPMPAASTRFTDSCATVVVFCNLFTSRSMHAIVVLVLRGSRVQFNVPTFQVIKSGLCLSFCCRFFHKLVSYKSPNSYRFLEIKCDSLCTDHSTPLHCDLKTGLLLYFHNFIKCQSILIIFGTTKVYSLQVCN